MARGKKENDIIINHIFPEKYNGWKVKCSNIRERKIDQKNTGKNVRYADELHIVEDFETNVVKADLDYELMTMLENETKCPATQMIKSHKRYDWREYFFTSPYLEIFGIEEPIIRLLYLKDMMNQMIIVFILAEKYIVGEEDIPDDTYTALDKLIKEYKKKAQPKKDLIPQEKNRYLRAFLVLTCGQMNIV